MHSNTNRYLKNIFSIIRTTFLSTFRWITLFIFFTVSIIFWTPRVFPRIDSHSILVIFSIPIKILLSCFLIYSSYHLTAYIFAIFRIKRHVNHKLTLTLSKKFDVDVGIIMTVCNDFNEHAANTMLEQDYRNFHLYICDDSCEKNVQETVNTFYLNNYHKTTIIRRDSRQGYKAGNINYILRSGIIKESLLLLVDADERLESLSLRSLVAEFISKRPSFLQASHHALKPEQDLVSSTDKSVFGNDIRSMGFLQFPNCN